MSFYRSFIVAVASLAFAGSVLAADENTTSATQTPAGDTTAQSTAATTDSNNTNATSPVASNETQQEKLDLNKATVKELMKIKGINAAKAKAIVSYRKKHGDFKSLDDLKEVKGFKKMNAKTMKKLEEQLTVG